MNDTVRFNNNSIFKLHKFVTIFYLIRFQRDKVLVFKFASSFEICKQVILIN